MTRLCKKVSFSLPFGECLRYDPRLWQRHTIPSSESIYDFLIFFFFWKGQWCSASSTRKLVMQTRSRANLAREAIGPILTVYDFSFLAHPSLLPKALHAVLDNDFHIHTKSFGPIRGRDHHARVILHNRVHLHNRVIDSIRAPSSEAIPSIDSLLHILSLTV